MKPFHFRSLAEGKDQPLSPEMLVTLENLAQTMQKKALDEAERNFQQRLMDQERLHREALEARYQQGLEEARAEAALQREEDEARILRLLEAIQDKALSWQGVIAHDQQRQVEWMTDAVLEALETVIEGSTDEATFSMLRVRLLALWRVMVEAQAVPLRIQCSVAAGMLPLVERYREAWRDFFPGVEVDYVADASLDLGDVTVRAEGYHLGYFHQDWKAKIRQILLSS